MMTDEAQPLTSSSSDANIPPPEPDPPPNAVKMSFPPPSQFSQPQPPRSRAHSSGTSEENQSSSPNSSSTPPWLRWSRGLDLLLNDEQGKDLFEKYLDQEGCSAQLNFIWACEGLKATAVEDPPKIPQLVRTIHRHFIQNMVLLGTSDTTRAEVTQAIKNEGRFNEVGLFDKAETEVRTHMRNNLYPNFLKSEIYLCAVTGEDEPSLNLHEQLEMHPAEGSPTGRTSSTGETSSLGTQEETKPNITTALVVDVDQKSNATSGGQSPKIPSPPLSTAPSVLLPNQLQTVHEDTELSVNSQQSRNSKLKLGLTKQALHMTEKIRSSVPVPPAGRSTKIRSREGFTSHYHPKPGSSTTAVPHPYHASYSSYNPVSCVDSEIQSMSSDAMTDDGAHSGHGHSVRKHGAHSHRSKGQMSSCSSSHIQSLHHPAHPRDSRRQLLYPVEHKDNRDNLQFAVHPVGPCRTDHQKTPTDPKEFVKLLIPKLEEIKKKREADEKLSQRIECGEHIAVPNVGGASGGPGGSSGVFQNVLAAAINKLQVQDEGVDEDILDQHVSRVFRDITPDNRSPKLRSPTFGRRRGGPSLPPRPRRERDVISTFSGDSGNVHDYVTDTLPSTMTKSRSIPSELKIHDHPDFATVGASQRIRYNRGGMLGHGDPRHVPLALTTKKTSSEFLDSGISVLSGATHTPTVISASQPPPSLPCDRTDIRVAHWIVHDGCGDDRPRPRSTTSPPPRRAKKPPLPHPHHMPVAAPMSQPIAADEVRRKLSKKPSPLPTVCVPTQAVQVPLGQLSSSSSCANPLRHHSPPSSDESSSATKEHFISSFLYYEDNEVPFCVKIPSRLPLGRPASSPFHHGITLAVFKEHLPKRGNYRYFFKRECAEVDANVVQEEITDDSQELPIYEGKIVAHLRTCVGAPSISGISISEKL